MARIKIKDLPKDKKISREEMRSILGGSDDQQIVQFSVQNAMQKVQTYLSMQTKLTETWDKMQDEIAKKYS